MPYIQKGYCTMVRQICLPCCQEHQHENGILRLLSSTEKRLWTATTCIVSLSSHFTYTKCTITISTNHNSSSVLFRYKLI